MIDDNVAFRIAVLVVAWLLYFALHSLLASLGLKRWVARERPNWMPAYRLAYNVLALLLLIPPLILTYLERGPWLWQWTDLGLWIADGIAALAVVGLAWSLRWYDGAEFLGLRQWRDQVTAVEDQERLQLSPLHHYVRHPWYSLGLVIIWTRDMDLPFFISAVMVTLYFVVGSRIEERKLVQYHGDVYRRYRKMVPGIIPSPRRFLSSEQARHLISEVAEKPSETR
jgi:protein-S-isoprenylcysteine O-methyltransferase Ste14